MLLLGSAGLADAQAPAPPAAPVSQATAPDAPLPGAPPAATPAALDRVVDCRAASEMAEQAEGLPPGLLFAIGKIETGRPNPATGAIEPWPWATNQGGIGHYFRSAQDAINWTMEAQAQGLRSIDVGCFQINLFYHPEAFSTLDEAFDPATNAMYAARFLAALYRRAGGWPLAVAQYHSADPALGTPYGNRVYSAWNSSPAPDGVHPPGTLRYDIGHFEVGGSGPALAGVGMTGMTARIAGGPDPFVIRLSVRALGVQVILPSWATPGPAIRPVAASIAQIAGTRGLPVIQFPSHELTAANATLRPPARPETIRTAATPDPFTIRMPRGRRLPQVIRP